MRNHSLNASAGLSHFNATKPIYRKGKETPSLQADSAGRRRLSRFGTRSLNRDLEKTLAASMGSVGDKHTPTIKAVGMIVGTLGKRKGR